MRVGQYVRCPVILEEYDKEYPRCFILGRITAINDISEMITIRQFDLKNSRDYFSHAFAEKEFPWNKVDRCPASREAPVRTPAGEGHIIFMEKCADPEDDYQYYIQLESGKIEKYPECDLEIEYTALDYSPLRQMIRYEFQNPTWYCSRVKVSSNMHMVNNSVYGFKALTGCRTFLMPHQISSIVRMFEFRPIRYMLADEVGLGKTIEACSVIKILSEENKNLRVLYVVPEALVHQWINELKYKFNIHAGEKIYKVNSPKQIITSYEKLMTENLLLAQKWDVLVVDETHRALQNDDLYNRLLQLSKAAGNVLLLSATPIQNREKQYLRLLTLLQPEQYQVMSSERFRSILNKQRKIQKRINVIITHMEHYQDYKEDSKEKLEELAEVLEDKNLNKLIGLIDLESKDEGRKALGLALSYISENYRIERNIIRNRRDYISEPMGQRVFHGLPYEMKTVEEGYGESDVYFSLLQILISKLEQDEITSDVLKNILQASFSSPWALKRVLHDCNVKDSSLLSQVKLWEKRANEEMVRMDYLLDEDPFHIRGRLLKALDYIEQEIIPTQDNTGKIVVFSEYPETLWKFGEMLENRKIECVLFTSNMQAEELEDSVYEFQNTPSCRVILCDASGGEGRNFQNADWLIHLDLPWTANAIEQRIGRLDRLGRDPEHKKVRSVVIYSKGTLEEQLLSIWKDGLNIFEKSLSGMEIITGELNNLIDEALNEDLDTGLSDVLEDIKELMEETTDTVEEEQLYDSGSIIYKPMNQSIRNMLKTYTGGEGNPFEESMRRWATQAGLIGSNSENEIVEFEEENFSYKSAIQTLLIPPNWDKYKKTSIVRKAGKILGTFDRKTAITREDLIFYAPGDVVFDSIINNAIDSGRGRCCAISGSAVFEYKGFLITYNVEPDIKLLLDKNIPIQMMSQFRMYLPVTQIQVLVPLGPYDDVTLEDILEYVTDPVLMRDADHLGRRSGKKGIPLLEQFKQSYPENTWVELIKKVQAKGKKKAMEELVSRSDISAANKEISRIVQGSKSMSIYLGRDLEEIKKQASMYQAIYNALCKPRLTEDSICLMFLSR